MPYEPYTHEDKRVKKRRKFILKKLAKSKYNSLLSDDLEIDQLEFLYESIIKRRKK